MYLSPLQAVAILAAAALLPVFLLLKYVFRHDKADKEPAGLLIALFVFGMLSCYPAAKLEGPIDTLLLSIFAPMHAARQDNLIYYLYNFLSAVFGVGLIEEGCKFIVMWLLTSRNKNFNSLFDGIVYAVCVSLGFAGLENLLYVLNGGLHTAYVRALLSVPGHTFNAIFMGFFYTSWHKYKITAALEKNMLTDVFSTPATVLTKITLKPPVFSRKAHSSLLLAIVVPTLLHGLYDFFAFIDADPLLYGFVLIMYVSCFLLIKSVSCDDKLDGPLAASLFFQKYPHLQLTASLLLQKHPKYQDYILTDAPED